MSSYLIAKHACHVRTVHAKASGQLCSPVLGQESGRSGEWLITGGQLKRHLEPVRGEAHKSSRFEKGKHVWVQLRHAHPSTLIGMAKGCLTTVGALTPGRDDTGDALI